MSRRPTVHLVYPTGNAVSCPQAIGRNLARILREKYEVRQYDWAETRWIAHQEGDVLLGHPSPLPWTAFRMSSRMKGWGRIIAMSPFNGDPRQVAFADRVLRRCDLYLAITGRYWARRVDRSPVAHWAPKMAFVDLAVDRCDFPRVKERFNPIGKRRILYIGHSGWTKNVGYLSKIACALPDVEFGWAGRGKGIPGLAQHGFLDFSNQRARKIVSQYDFFITVGRWDANPATILESMSWGLIPVCTPSSGYCDYPGIVNVPLDDVSRACEIIRTVLSAPEEKLDLMRRANDELLVGYFNWDRFGKQVIDAIESKESPPMLVCDKKTRISLAVTASLSPYSPIWPRNLALDGKRRLVRAAKTLRMR